MKNWKLLKKLSFREGFFCVMLLAAILCRVWKFAQTSELSELMLQSLFYVLFFVALSGVCAIKRLSEERAERMIVIGFISLIMMFLVDVALFTFWAITGEQIVMAQLFGLYILLVLGYAVILQLFTQLYGNRLNLKS